MPLLTVFQTINKPVDKEKLETLGLIVSYAGKKVLSNGGVILFALEKYRNQYFPDARVSCARFRGTDKSDFIYMGSGLPYCTYCRSGLIYVCWQMTDQKTFDREYR